MLEIHLFIKSYIFFAVFPFWKSGILHTFVLIKSIFASSTKPYPYLCVKLFHSCCPYCWALNYNTTIWFNTLLHIQIQTVFLTVAPKSIRTLICFQNRTSSCYSRMSERQRTPRDSFGTDSMFREIATRGKLHNISNRTARWLAFYSDVWQTFKIGCIDPKRGSRGGNKCLFNHAASNP